ncbi:MAG: InlB B-repeat-containing protein, partial [Clostridia bacterium]|nr:InlB B-repeat-containing protein [Clostridia bacterium]
MKIKYLILSGVIFLVVAISGITLYSCWPAITGTINKNKYYTNQDMEANYEKGFQEGCSNFIELTGQVDYYKDLTDVYYLQILELQDTVKSLESSNKTNLETVSQLENQKQVLESEVANLEINIANNNKTISDLNSQIAVLQTQAEQVPSLNSQIANLQATSLQLQAVNNSNAATITNLNNQIISLNNQISEMSSLSQNAGSQITILNNRINELQATVSYYESYISQLENAEKAVATYEVDGTVWKIEILNKGTVIDLATLTSTEAKIFNGWKIDGQDELLGETYTLNTNTKFVADITYKHTVKFMVDDQVYDNQYVVENESAIIPTAPVKADYEFVGWSLNGVDIVENIDTTKVEQNMTYQAIFSKIHTVTFMVDDQVVATQKVRNGKCANASEVMIETDGELSGWQNNGVDVNISDYQIFADTLFSAKIIYTTWTEMTWNGLTSFFGEYVWTDGVSTYYSKGSEQYILDRETNTWSLFEWEGFSDFYGSYVWTDGENIYYSMNSEQYILDRSLHKWISYTWNNGPVYSNGNSRLRGDYIWTDGVDTYLLDGSVVYVLEKSNNSWVRLYWPTSDISYHPQYIWTDGVEFYVKGNNSVGGDGKTYKVYTLVKAPTGTQMSVAVESYHLEGEDQVGKETFAVTSGSLVGTDAWELVEFT